MRMIKKCLISCLVLAFLVVSTQAWANEKKPSGGAMIVDLPIRIISMPVIVVGLAFFVVAIPFTLPSGSFGSSWDALVVEPFKFTFIRPLGQFEDWRDLE